MNCGIRGFKYSEKIGKNYRYRRRRFTASKIHESEFTLITPIIGDAEPYHRGFGRNFLYPEGHAGQYPGIFLENE